MSLLTQRVSKFLASRPDIKSAVIWGAGQVGDQLTTLIEQQFPDIVLRGIVDSSIHEKKCVDGRDICPVSLLSSIDLDIVIIASIAFENHIYESISRAYPELVAHVFRISQEGVVEEKLRKIQPYDDDVLTNLAFDYPDSPGIWDELADRAQNEDMKELYLACARCLRNDV